MTTIITRYFDSATKARSARAELINYRRLSPKIIDLYDDAEGVADRLIAASVDDETARVYADRMANGGAVVLVRAGYKPLSVGNTTRDVLEEMGALDLGDLNEDVYINLAKLQARQYGEAAAVATLEEARAADPTFVQVRFDGYEEEDSPVFAGMAERDLSMDAGFGVTGKSSPMIWVNKMARIR